MHHIATVHYKRISQVKIGTKQRRLACHHPVARGKKQQQNRTITKVDEMKEMIIPMSHGAVYCIFSYIDIAFSYTEGWGD